VEISDFILGFNGIDLLLIGFFAAFFILGFAQGTIRRLIGIGSILFSFLFAANLSAWLGTFLGDNWTQFAPEYGQMIGFLAVFVTGCLVFAILAQGFYKPQPLFQKARFVDEIIGGILGVIEAGLILLCFIVILDTFFRSTGIPADPDELPYLREIYDALNGSQVVIAFRDVVIPAFMTVFSFMVPTPISDMY
jgi:membrane protein required for colicin V production